MFHHYYKVQRTQNYLYDKIKLEKHISTLLMHIIETKRQTREEHSLRGTNESEFGDE